MQTTIILKDPFSLKLHPLQRHLPEPEKKSTEWAAFLDSIQAGGITEPLVITPDDQVVSGGRRWRAARLLELPEVPCLVRPENEAALIIVEGLLQRRNMTRGAAVYLSLYMLQDFVAAAESRRLANLKSGVKTRENPLKVPNGSNSDPATITELLNRWGIDWKTWAQARKVFDLFAKSKSLREEWEPRLLSGEYNLWNIISGIGGAGTDQSKRETGVLAGQFELFTESFCGIRRAFRGWSKFAAEQRDKVLAEWEQTVDAMPDDLRDEMAKRLEKANS